MTGNALVVGHSNSIPDLIKALGIDGSVNIQDSDYTQLFIVALGSKPQLLQLHYPNDLKFKGNNAKTAALSMKRPPRR